MINFISKNYKFAIVLKLLQISKSNYKYFKCFDVYNFDLQLNFIENI